MPSERQAHWDAAYDHGDRTRSWYQTEPTTSLRVLDQHQATPADSVVDVGGGASPLVDALLQRGHRDLTVLDLSPTALTIARTRLGDLAQHVHWHTGDVLEWQPARTFDVWHDRAAFHFLTTADQRQQYLHTLNAATREGSLAVLATFAPDGPDACSGLPTARYDAAQLATTLGPPWELLTSAREEHRTPNGHNQPFTWAALRRRA